MTESERQQRRPGYARFFNGLQASQQESSQIQDQLEAQLEVRKAH